MAHPPVTARGAWARAGLLTAAVVAVDQLTKAWARGALERGERRDFLPLLDLVNVRNTGVAFGLAAGGTTLVIVLVAVALIAVLAFFATHLHRPLAWLPTGLLLGGAVGNVVDRIRDGAVTDFLKLPAWPAFNIADVAITFGVLALLLVIERDGAARDR